MKAQDMYKLSEVCSCVKRLHADLQNRVKSDTLVRYKNALDPFLKFLGQVCELSDLQSEDMDFWIMTYRDEAELSRSQHGLLVAAVEFFLPYYKSKLTVSREALKGRLATDPVKHTTPITRECVHLFATWHASQGRTRLGAAVILQFGTGLRPSELLALRGHHVHVPLTKRENITIRLGVVISTKIKREQYVLVNAQEQSVVYELLSGLRRISQPDDLLFPFSYSHYNHSFRWAEQWYGLDLGLTAHSGRAGFATSLITAGVEASRVQQAGRWRAESSFRTYIDVVTSLHAGIQVKVAGLAETAAWVEANWWRYFEELKINACPSQEQQPRGSSRPTQKGKPLPGATSTGSLHSLSETAMARRTTQLTARNQQSTRSTAVSSAHTSAKGRGRGRLLSTRKTTESIFL